MIKPVNKNSSILLMKYENNYNNTIDIINSADNEIDSNINFNRSSTDIIIDKKNKLLKYIKDSKKKLNTSLYIISCKYEIVYYKYNFISLYILIISTIITFMEAIRLTITSYLIKTNSSISTSKISLIISIIELLLGTLLTILSSIIKFKNYRDIMEKLKHTQGILFNYKCLYNRQKEIIVFFEIYNVFTEELFKEIYEKIEKYNSEIKDINIFEDIIISDIIKFNKYKIDNDLKLEKLYKYKEFKLLKNTFKNNIKKQKININ